MEIVVLKRTSRILSGHLWVFSNELAESPKKFAPGSLLELRDRRDNFLGIGYVNPNSLISVRILTRQREEIDKGFFKRRISSALEYRMRFLRGADSFRAIFSEGDLLPGLIVDKYADTLSAQFLTLGMEARSDAVLEALDEVFSPRVIVLRNDSPARTLEGLALEKRVVKGSLEGPVVIRDGGLLFEIDPLSGQKTGFFLDQAENRRAFAQLTGAGEALDLFCNTGAWALHMARNGASVTGVDSSGTAVDAAKKNAELNGLADRCVFLKADVFEFAKGDLAKGRLYDYIVLDPPAFVKSKAKINEALRAYRELNSACMKLLKKGGLLATSSCSYHVNREAFMEVLRSSAKDAGKSVRIVETRSQAKDHPPLLSVPETEYLKCVILEAC
ncbi:MAG: class I SAM-dependent rRNA methyltransferase [Deltaproteobacteria bacterium]|nr:class I SAM-dependent rRNA methyltransferase [Deltaproteobacteria bacterium]